MLYFLSFLLSWLCGMLVILISAFCSYDQFTIVDISSFAVMTFAGLLALFVLVYLLLLRTINSRVIHNQLILYPLIFSMITNSPIYFFIWQSNGNYYGKSEAILFTLGFLTSGFVFGLFWAWKNRMRANIR